MATKEKVEKIEDKPLETSSTPPPAIGDLMKRLETLELTSKTNQETLGSMKTTLDQTAEKMKLLDQVEGMIKPVMEQLQKGTFKTGNPLIDGMLGPIFKDLSKFKKNMAPKVEEKKG